MKGQFCDSFVPSTLDFWMERKNESRLESTWKSIFGENFWSIWLKNKDSIQYIYKISKLTEFCEFRSLKFPFMCTKFHNGCWKWWMNERKYKTSMLTKFQCCLTKDRHRSVYLLDFWKHVFSGANLEVVFWGKSERFSPG